MTYVAFFLKKLHKSCTQLPVSTINRSKKNKKNNPGNRVSLVLPADTPPPGTPIVYIITYNTNFHLTPSVVAAFCDRYNGHS